MCANILPCPLCEQPNFRSIDSLRISLVNVTNRPLDCPICRDVLYGLDKLTIHLFSHSLNQNKSAETGYGNFMVNVDLSTPSNENKIEAFPSENRLNRRSASPSNETVSLNQPNQNCAPSKQIIEPQCDMCGANFSTHELHRLHLKLVHEASDEDIQRNESVIGEKDHKNCFPCHLCSKYFKMKGSLRVHLKVVHSFGKTGRISIPILDCYKQATPLCNNATELRGADGVFSAENKLNNAEVKAWECDVCAKSFTTKYFLKKHKRLHTGEMPYRCEICGKNFTFQQSYHKHLLYHSDEKPHICCTCGRAFKELSTLHNHERIHSGEKPFQCETCDKCFRQRVSYLVHRRIHTGSMPYKCTACEKSFRYKVSQRTHKCLAEPPGNEHIDVADKDFLNQSLDEFVKESCDKIGIGDDGNISFQDGTTTIPIEVQIPSPSEKFQNMCLYSPAENVAFNDSLDLYGDDDVGL
ncbi:zinc finger protein 2 isoform X2 [Bradysia coprophila]|uniref:zinc finger protein 2 isoform X2 n=1 Tax=Bradysia coprophila TaxID=38358 RepID=UPI00187D9341|nr:zinc finger protein 2 isoform X2 [Bradysia coprophila]